MASQYTAPHMENSCGEVVIHGTKYWQLVEVFLNFQWDKGLEADDGGQAADSSLEQTASIPSWRTEANSSTGAK